jgi:hypothetical protein
MQSFTKLAENKKSEGVITEDKVTKSISEEKPARHFQDFEKVTYDPTEYMKMNGKSVAENTLYIMKKVLRPGDNPDKEKYKAIHFLKYIPNINRDCNSALDEVRAQEFLRLMLPRQPKARVVTTDYGQGSCVQSKGIEGFTRVYPNDEYQLLDPDYYATKKYRLQVVYPPLDLKDEDIQPETVYLYIKDGELKYAVNDADCIKRLPFPVESGYDSEIKRILEAKKKLTEKQENIILFECGHRGGFKGLGELNIFAGYVLDDADYNYRNIGYNKKSLLLYKIDGGRSFWGGGFGSPYYYQNGRHGGLLENKIYNHEVMQSMLKLIVLPDSLIEAFVASYSSGDGASGHDISNAAYFRRQRDSVRGSVSEWPKEKLAEILSPDFSEYCFTQQAVEDLKEFKDYLATFKTSQKHFLLAQCPHALEEIDTYFKSFCDLLQKKKDTPVEVQATDAVPSSLLTEEKEQSEIKLDNNSQDVSASMKAAPSLFREEEQPKVKLDDEPKDLSIRIETTPSLLKALKKEKVEAVSEAQQKELSTMASPSIPQQKRSSYLQQFFSHVLHPFSSHKPESRTKKFIF